LLGGEDYVPSGSPSVLNIFLVIIEIVSLWVRPFAMVLRLCINLLCGHLLLAISRLGSSFIVIILEIMVAIVQVIVLCTLIVI